jgi:hypothetical protein
MRIAMILCGLLWLGSSAWAQASYVNEQGSLKGLPGVGVLVEAMKDNTRGAVTKESVQTDVELRLRQLGIKVFPTWDQNSATLYVNVNLVRNSTVPLSGFSVEVAVQQMVRLDRAPTVRMVATTWHTGSAGSVGAETVGQIRQIVINLVDRFANDFLAANPK